MSRSERRRAGFFGTVVPRVSHVFGSGPATQVVHDAFPLGGGHRLRPSDLGSQRSSRSTYRPNRGNSRPGPSFRGRWPPRRACRRGRRRGCTGSGTRPGNRHGPGRSVAGASTGGVWASAVLRSARDCLEESRPLAAHGRLSPPREPGSSSGSGVVRCGVEKELAAAARGLVQRRSKKSAGALDAERAGGTERAAPRASSPAAAASASARACTA